MDFDISPFQVLWALELYTKYVKDIYLLPILNSKCVYVYYIYVYYICTVYVCVCVCVCVCLCLCLCI